MKKDFHLDSKRDSRLIATGVSDCGHHTKIRVWEATVERKSEIPDLTSDRETIDEVRTPPPVLLSPTAG